MMKKVLSAFLSIVILLSILPAGVVSVNAAAVKSYGKLDYIVTNGEVTISDARVNIRGAITIPEKIGNYTVTSIGEGAFADCTGLTSISIPDSVTDIGNQAFFFCTGLKSVAIPDSVTSIGSEAFYGCSDLASAILGKNVKTIGTFAFGYCSKLASIAIGDKVTSVGETAFAGCSKLTAITIGKRVTDVGYRAFSNTAYSNDTSNWNNGFLCIDGCLVDADSTVSGKIVIPDGTRLIANSLFSGRTGLTSVSMPNSVTNIGDAAFYGCSGLTSIAISNNVTRIGNGAFRGCKKLTSITIPSSVTSIGDSAFEKCTGLTSVTIPNSVTSMGDAVFAGCSGLTAVNLSNHVTSIPYRTFAGCAKLASVSIPGGVTKIGDSAFEACSGLTSIAIPNSVTKIGDFAFGGCSGLKTVYFSDETQRGKFANMFDSAVNKVVCAVTPTATNTASGVKLTWTDNCKATTYIVWRSYYAGGKWSDKVKFKTTTAKSWTDTTAKPGVQYRYLVRAYRGNTKLAEKTVSIRRTVTAITTQPKNTYTKNGATAKVTVTATGDGLKYQWYIKNAGQTKYTKSSITSSTYSVKMSDKVKDRYIYCVVTDQYGNSVKSKTVVLRMAASITAQPTHTYAKQGATAKVTVKAAGDGLKYQWYIKNAGQTKYTKSSITSSTYSVKMSNTVNGRYIYCIVTDKYGKTVRSNTVALKKK